jgi:hypothetical protein
MISLAEFIKRYSVVMTPQNRTNLPPVSSQKMRETVYSIHRMGQSGNFSFSTVVSKDWNSNDRDILAMAAQRASAYAQSPTLGKFVSAHGIPGMDTVRSFEECRRIAGGLRRVLGDEAYHELMTGTDWRSVD